MQAEQLLSCCEQLQDDTEYEMAKKVVNFVSDINEEIFEQITSGGEKMSDKLRHMLLPELKELEKQLADKDAETARLRQELDSVRTVNA